MVVAQVNIWGTLVGAVAWDEAKGVAVFEYDHNFLQKRLDLSPIKMPMNRGGRSQPVFSFKDIEKETYQGLPGLLADCLPDRFGNQLIEAWLTEQGRPRGSLNPVELLCYIGSRGMGALEFIPSISGLVQSSELLEIKELVKLASKVLHDRDALHTDLSNDTKTGLSDIIQVGTSAGGARAKAVIAFNPQTGEVRSGQAQQKDGFEHWLIKFDGVTNDLLGDPKGYGRIEYAYHLMAKASGIKMNECLLFEEDGRAHFMTKRFDRVGQEKLHMQTLCGIAHFDYNQPRAYTYEQAFQVMRQLRLPFIDAEEFFRRMAFNVLAFNCDDHTKNISFLMNRKGEWRLSPAYDVTYSYDPASYWVSAHQLSVNGKRTDICVEDLMVVADKMNIKRAAKIIASVKAAIAEWSSFAQEAGMLPEQTKAINGMINPKDLG